MEIQIRIALYIIRPTRSCIRHNGRSASWFKSGVAGAATTTIATIPGVATTELVPYFLSDHIPETIAINILNACRAARTFTFGAYIAYAACYAYGSTAHVTGIYVTNIVVGTTDGCVYY